MASLIVPALAMHRVVGNVFASIRSEIVKGIKMSARDSSLYDWFQNHNGLQLTLLGGDGEHPPAEHLHFIEELQANVQKFVKDRLERVTSKKSKTPRSKTVAESDSGTPVVTLAEDTDMGTDDDHDPSPAAPAEPVPPTLKKRKARTPSTPRLRPDLCINCQQPAVIISSAQIATPIDQIRSAVISPIVPAAPKRRRRSQSSKAADVDSAVL